MLRDKCQVEYPSVYHEKSPHNYIIPCHTRLQNSRIFCESERREQYANERSGAGVQTARKARDAKK